MQLARLGFYKLAATAQPEAEQKAGNGVHPPKEINSKAKGGAMDTESLVLWRRPLTTLDYFGRELSILVTIGLHRLLAYKVLALSIVLVILGTGSVLPHRWTASAEAIWTLAWWGWWVGLGVCSSVGLGTGLHTFLLYLGPHIARVTLAAYECRSAAFPRPPYPHEIICPANVPADATVSIWEIMSLVRMESMLWGAGTALGSCRPTSWRAPPACPAPPPTTRPAPPTARERAAVIEAVVSSAVVPQARVSVWEMMSLVRMESMLWGAGTALGELPPYFMARAARLSGAAAHHETSAADSAAFMMNRDIVSSILSISGPARELAVVIEAVVASAVVPQARVSVWEMMSLVESMLWGAGTALGELPPYSMARAARLSGAAAHHETSATDSCSIECGCSSSAGLRLGGHVAGAHGEHAVGRGTALGELPPYLPTGGKVFVEKLVQRVGFFGILACASVPNPLFDLAGITCGHFLVPFWTFFGATVLGKAVIKMHIQKVFVIVAFNESLVGQAIAIVERMPYIGPYLGTTLLEFLRTQKGETAQKRQFRPGSRQPRNHSIFSIGEVLSWLWSFTS
ncbi:unnamed protein product [Plutella xylostella]|uniref:(diamondback moth) hypothetical protein n=1 Tax=Plutella xylostella TaxID=51655 RepID=A0A8S4DTJ3_PLUXY|nr:unnamed protein product [Plutella xylostella]